jgi:hypothetical protein
MAPIRYSSVQSTIPVTTLPPTTRLLTTVGWVSAGDLDTGSVLRTAAGGVVAVKSISAGQDGPIHRMTLGDGTSVELGAEQVVAVELGRGSQRRPKTVSVSELAAWLSAEQRVRVQKVKPIPLGYETLPALGAYGVGALIGDGSFANGRSAVLFASEDDIAERVRADLPPGADLSANVRQLAGTRAWQVIGCGADGRNITVAVLRELGLAGHIAPDKFLPAVYKQGTVAERLALMAGLLDTDGYVDEFGRVSFSTASPRLAADVLEVVQSLAGRATLYRRTGVKYTSPSQRTPKEALDAFKIGAISLGDLCPIRSARKLMRWSPPTQFRLWGVREVRALATASTVHIELATPDAHVIANGYVPILGMSEAHQPAARRHLVRSA